MVMTFRWSDRFESLAQALFSGARERADPFDTECTVVGSPVMAGWLKQYFLYDLPAQDITQRVLAGWEFKMLHPFVNDWLAKACGETEVGERDADRHPYAPGVLQWRIWMELRNTGVYPALDAYVGNDPKVAGRKRRDLAVRLANLFDGYQNYRGDLLDEWEHGSTTGLDANLVWQAELWRNLVKDRPETYLSQFKGMSGKLKNCGIHVAYRRITIFHASAMPRAYLEFFRELGTFMDVEVFVFNPSREFWIEDLPVRQHIQTLKQHGDEPAWFDPPHPILGGFGRGMQAFLATALDVTGGQINDAQWGPDRDATLLQKVQADIRNKGFAGIQDPEDDGSIQFHVCHGPLREVEVVRDLVLQWFAEHPEAQPRDVQVLVPDMETYAPFIESVFRIRDHLPPVPCSVSKRPAVSAGAVGAAFVRLMKFHQGRMSAPEAVEILELEPVRERYGLAAGDLSEIRGLINAAGIRWGRDGAHLDVALDRPEAGLPDTVTWRRGLDRLLAGFAVGRCGESDDLIHAGGLGVLGVCDTVEGNTAEQVGKLAQYFEDLCKTADETGAGTTRKVSEWAELYSGLLERFFRATENSFIELAEIRRGIQAVARAAEVAGDPGTDVDAMAAAIEAQLGGMEPAGPCDTNAVLFSPMRTMQVTPRKLLVVLGLNESCFPRADARPAFDLLARKPRYGDRSLRYEDRLSFLEALMSARERLIVTYTGRNISDNKPIPPSPAVTEFRQYLDSCSTTKGDRDRKKLLIEPVDHKLHGFNPEYYQRETLARASRAKDGGDWRTLFSYSRSNYDAACVLAGPPAEGGAAVRDRASPAGLQTCGPAEPPAGPAQTAKDIPLETLQAFFVNPAKYFFTHILEIRLPDPARDGVTDSEMFDGDTLDDYQINDLMLKDFLVRSRCPEEAGFEVDADYFKRLQEKALIPLGTFGLGRTRQRFSGLQQFLNQTKVYSRHPNLYQALRDLEECKQEPTSIRVECTGYGVHGSLPVMTDPKEGPGQRTFVLRFRFAALNPRERVRAWLGHVVGHAAGLTFYTDLVGRENVKGTIKPEMETIAPIDKDAATARLAQILDLFEAGNRRLLPFAPASAYEYAKRVDASDPPETATALEAAYNTWAVGDYAEFNEPYLFAAWGEPGPMEHPGFAVPAIAFWGDYSARSRSGQPKDKASGPEKDDA